MAIISCPKCSRSISEYAKICPHCSNESIYPNSINKMIVEQSQSKIIGATKESNNSKSLGKANSSKPNKVGGTIVFVFLLIILFLVLINSTTENSSEYKSSDFPNSSSSSFECQGTGDESFIRNKMSQMNRDILELNKIGSRKYYVRYISWSSGTAIEGDQVLDYSNSPCND